ncbi:MAG: hypothetical protein AAFQ43_03280 [Bacteroidota bacterium]
MDRLLPLLALSGLLAACTPSMAPEAAIEAAEAAEASGDARKALRYYRAAAEAGDLGALRTVATAYDRGYLRTSGGFPVTNLPVFVWPGQDGRWRDRYETERDRRALSGDPSAWMQVADDLTVWNRDETQADRDSARAIRQRLVDEGEPFALVRAGLETVHNDRDAGLALLRRADAAGHPQACHLLILFERGDSALVTAKQWAEEIDRLAQCPVLDPEKPSRGETVIRNLRDAVDRGDAEAQVHLDSLRTLGVFERHPRLDEI